MASETDTTKKKIFFLLFILVYLLIYFYIYLFTHYFLNFKHTVQDHSHPQHMVFILIKR